MTPSSKLAARILELTNRPGFTLPGTSKEVATMRALAELALDSDGLLSAEALHYAQQGVLLFAINRAAGSTFEEKLQDRSNRALFEAYSLLISGLKRKDNMLSRCTR